MAFFKYKAYSKDNKSITGLVEAPAREQATRLLRDKELLVVSIEETHNSSLQTVLLRVKKVSFGEIVNFTRQLSTMVTAGLSLPESLSILQKQSTNPIMTQMLADMERQVTGGGSFASALSKYPQYFSDIYVALVKAGEASGQLEKILSRLAESLESQREFRAKVVGAMIYPIIIIVGMIVVVAIMMIVVMPKMTDLYKDFQIELPATTKLLIAISNFMVHGWWAILLIGFGLFYGLSRWKKTPVGEHIIDTMMLKIPIFGDLQKKITLVEFTRTLAMLISAGIHILDALRILKMSLGNVLFRDAMDDIMKKVEKGYPMGDTFAAHSEFPPIVSQMMKVGEETGKLDETLLKLSVYFQSETENLVKGLTTAIEPAIMVVLGVGVGFIVMSIITPIYNLTAQFK